MVKRRERITFDESYDAFGTPIRVGDRVVNIYQPEPHRYILRKGTVVGLHERQEPQPTEVIEIVNDGDDRVKLIKKQERVMKIG